jgi:hypothetical protein
LQYNDVESSSSPQFEQTTWLEAVSLPTGDVVVTGVAFSFVPQDLQNVQLDLTAALQDGHVFSSLVSRRRSLSASPHHLQ